jgi:ribosomal protein S18 acetylase RimI-like enzyme
MVTKTIALLVIGAAVYGQDLKPVIDNDRVTAWDTTTGDPRLARNVDHDVVVMELTGTHARTASFIPKGGVIKPCERCLVIELKDRIGRLAVGEKFHGRGLGGALLVDATRRTLQAAPAVYALVVDAKNDQAVAFYQRYLFRLMVGHPRTLFLPLATAQKALLE